VLAHKNFEVHGTLDLSLEDHILTIEGEGPWNMESMYAANEKVQPFAAQLIGQPWAVLAILRGDPIYVPAAAKMLSNIVKQDIENGRVATAVLLNQSNSPEFGKRHLAEIYRSAGEIYEFFDDEKTARSWLNSKLKQL
jgi:hypothetical protein